MAILVHHNSFSFILNTPATLSTTGNSNHSSPAPTASAAAAIAPARRPSQINNISNNRQSSSYHSTNIHNSSSCARAIAGHRRSASPLRITIITHRRIAIVSPAPIISSSPIAASHRQSYRRSIASITSSSSSNNSPSASNAYPSARATGTPPPGPSRGRARASLNCILQLTLLIIMSAFNNKSTNNSRDAPHHRIARRLSIAAAMRCKAAA